MRPALLCLLLLGTASCDDPNDTAATTVDAGAAPSDASTQPASDARVDEEEEGREIYSAARMQSPITSSIRDNLQAIASRRSATVSDNVFMKVGDSISTNVSGFMTCFDNGTIDLGDIGTVQATIDYYSGSFDHQSEAAVGGWSTHDLLEGSPNALEEEWQLIEPGGAIVMYGTNHLGIGANEVFLFGRDMWRIADELANKGTVPVLSSIPNIDRAVDSRVPWYNAVVRGLAQELEIPFVDLNQALRVVPGRGLGGDGVHLSGPSNYQYCDLSASGRIYGANERNYVSIQALDRVRRTLAAGLALDESAARRAGAGTAADPFVVTGDAIFAAMGDTSTSTENELSAYSCSPDTDETGPEVLFRLELDTPATVRAMLITPAGVDVDLHLLSETPSAAACTERNDRLLVSDLDAGTHWYSVDTYVTQGVPQSGKFLLVLMRE